MKLCILVACQFLITNLNFGVNQCIFGHVILQNMKFIYKIGHIWTIFKDRDFWFGRDSTEIWLFDVPAQYLEEEAFK